MHTVCTVKSDELILESEGSLSSELVSRLEEAQPIDQELVKHPRLPSPPELNPEVLSTVSKNGSNVTSVLLPSGYRSEKHPKIQKK